MGEKQSVGCLFSWPVIIIMMFVFFPIGLILLIARIVKEANPKQQMSFGSIPQYNVSKGSVEIPQDLLAKGAEIQNNLKKELYCNKKDLPREIFNETKWLWLLQLLVIGLYIYVISTCSNFGTGFLWTLLFIGAPWPIYWNIIKRTREVKENNRFRESHLRETYQATFNALVFSEYIERRLVSAGIEHSENDGSNPNDIETKKFYHYGGYYKQPLRYKYANDETEFVSSFTGFSFDNSLWKFGPFCYSVINRDFEGSSRTAQMLFYSRKPIENEVVIFRKNSEFFLNGEVANSFKKFEMDNSRFNQTFDVYAKDSLELFKVFTPAYMEKIINIADRMGIGMLSIRGNCVEVIFDSNFPVLKNPSYGYNVPQALADAEGIFQYFMYFMESVSCIGIN